MNTNLSNYLAYKAAAIGANVVAQVPGMDSETANFLKVLVIVSAIVVIIVAFYAYAALERYCLMRERVAADSAKGKV